MLDVGLGASEDQANLHACGRRRRALGPPLHAVVGHHVVPYSARGPVSVSPAAPAPAAAFRPGAYTLNLSNSRTYSSLSWVTRWTEELKLR